MIKNSYFCKAYKYYSVKTNCSTKEKKKEKMDIDKNVNTIAIFYFMAGILSLRVEFK